jgi:hypothetical protein
LGKCIPRRSKTCSPPTRFQNVVTITKKRSLTHVL